MYIYNKFSWICKFDDVMLFFVDKYIKFEKKV